MFTPDVSLSCLNSAPVYPCLDSQSIISDYENDPITAYYNGLTVSATETCFPLLTSSFDQFNQDLIDRIFLSDNNASESTDSDTENTTLSGRTERVQRCWVKNKLSGCEINGVKTTIEASTPASEDPAIELPDGTPEKILSASIPEPQKPGAQSKLFFCTQCTPKRSYATRNARSVHIYSFHSAIEDRTCKTCDKSFTSRHGLYMHNKGVHKMRTQRMAVNHKMNTALHDTQMHKKNHRVAHPVARRVVSLVSQLETGKTEGPYRCLFSSCNKVFAQRGLFTRHVRTHTLH